MTDEIKIELELMQTGVAATDKIKIPAFSYCAYWSDHNTNADAKFCGTGSVAEMAIQSLIQITLQMDRIKDDRIERTIEEFAPPKSPLITPQGIH